eukprot:1161047-Pelagomonas_calceolata.AAC.6
MVLITVLLLILAHRGRGGGRGGKMGGGAKVVVEAHRHDGVFIARGKEDALVTRNLVPGVSVYQEKRIATEVPKANGEGTDKVGKACPRCKGPHLHRQENPDIRQAQHLYSKHANTSTPAHAKCCVRMFQHGRVSGKGF